MWPHVRPLEGVEYPKILDLISMTQIVITEPSLFELETESFSTAFFKVGTAVFQFRIGDAKLAGLSFEKAETIELKPLEECSGE